MASLHAEDVPLPMSDDEEEQSTYGSLHPHQDPVKPSIWAIHPTQIAQALDRDSATHQQDPETSSELDIAANNHSAIGDSSAFLDRETTRRLLEIESSFMPDEPISDVRAGEALLRGADDTFVFAGSPGRVMGHTKDGGDEGVGGSNTQAQSESPPASAYKTPYPFARTNSTVSGRNESSEITNSPAAAAAKRAQMRTTNAGYDTEGSLHSRNNSRKIYITRNATETPPGIAQDVDDAEQLVKPEGINEHTSELTIASATRLITTEPTSSPRLSKRPSFHARQSSMRSAISNISSHSMIDELSETTLGADYALQSGGAAPADGAVRPSASFSRLPSVGSMAGSLLSSRNGSYRGWQRSRSSTSLSATHGEASLDNILTAQLQAQEASPPLTPRPGDYGQNAPTDTVIAQHVKNIQVPETVAREYRQMHNTRDTSPPRRQTNSLTFGRRNNLTLKEQNSKIDKLSKENFDLKLKIHFLDQALQNRSDEGVKDMINKNVQLQTDLATEKKDNQALKRKIREHERKVTQLEENGQAEKSEVAKLSDDDRSELFVEMEEEIVMLREVVQQCEVEIEHLRSDNLIKEVDKRRLAEHVRSLNDARSAEPRPYEEESADMWKDLLEAETARREQADADAASLREEIFKLKSDLASAKGAYPSLNTLNVNKRMTFAGASSRPSTAVSERSLGQDRQVDSRSSTLVDTLQHENAELRRDLSAQTQMLTSRNKERERLQQEIEDLKLHHRRGPDGVRSIAGDSIFERSISRAHQRSNSRASGVTRAPTQLSEQERDDYEKKTASLHDELAQIRMMNQDLERELNNHLDLLQGAEADNEALKQEHQLATEDLQALQSERDEVLQSLEEREEQFEQLREEALASIEELEAELQQKEQDFSSLQVELKSVSDSVLRLDGELQASRRREASLEQQIEDNERELAALEKKVRDTVSKNERLDVQLESSQGEVAFLREEQDADKLRIGELEAAISQAQTSLHEHKERTREMHNQFGEEKRQREKLDSQEKQAVQQMLDDLNRESQRGKEEIRKLRRGLQTKEGEASVWKERLESLEGALREALGDLDGTRSNLLKDVTKLQRDLEHTISNYESAKSDLAEREALLRSRDTLLETTALETRKLTELLDKERAARTRDRTQFDKMQSSQQSLTRTIQQTDNRTLEAETRLASEKKRWASAEHTYLQQLSDRNHLLFSLWNRLSALCSPGNGDNDGSSGALPHNFGSIDGMTPSVEVISRNLPGFTRNVNIAARTIEALVQGFRSRIREVERSLWRDVQKLEHGLEVRTKRLDHLERVLASTQASQARQDARSPNPNGGLAGAAARTATGTGLMLPPPAPGNAKLENEIRILKAELKHARRPDREDRPPSMRSVSDDSLLNPDIGDAGQNTLRRARGTHNQGGHAHKNSVESAVAAMPLPMNVNESSRRMSGSPSVNSDRPKTSATMERPRTSATTTSTNNIPTSPVPNIPMGPVGKVRGGHNNNKSLTMTRHHSTSIVETSSSSSRQPPPITRELSLTDYPTSNTENQPPHSETDVTSQQQPAGGAATEQRWIYRLKELERRLKAEREMRLLDRSGARKRIEEERGEKEELKRMLERERVLRDAVGAAADT